jgi:hypothetical protein
MFYDFCSGLLGVMFCYGGCEAVGVEVVVSGELV